jgi:hypothetical protein
MFFIFWIGISGRGLCMQISANNITNQSILLSTKIAQKQKLTDRGAVPIFKPPSKGLIPKIALFMG